MNLLFLGDIVGSAGRRAVKEILPHLLRQEQIHLAVANAENAAGGFGLTPEVAEELFAAGLDVLTSGNHIWDKKEILAYLDRQPRLLRPANYPPGVPGHGVFLTRARDGSQVAVINLQGRMYMPLSDCPFRKADEILASLEDAVKIRIVDFHAELTSEKMAMGWYLNGRVSAVIGTHTHVATADARILPGGTAYQTDVGMTGAYDSIIGMDKEIALRRLLTSTPVRLEAARGKVELHGLLVRVDHSTGRALHVERVFVEGS
ncbi:MAG: TIGR00282 family metallophosphoesterase [Bryobacterales bacterium]|nr:TIGR00282 family metallophosphoesterase [Bryobacteraceae bacterium]MDW8129428.1 TIGR00282 family metallophosphoesterase [Bryobacterales bacterium]